MTRSYKSTLDIKVETLLIAIALIIVGVMTSTPIKIDLSKTFIDLDRMGIKIFYGTLLGGMIIFIASKFITKLSSDAARFIGSVGVYLVLYPSLTITSSFETVSTWLAIGSVISLAMVSYVVADYITKSKTRADKIGV